MINPNELRFGNVVLAPTLTFNGVTMMPTILSYFNEYDATLAQPIPLTHEILENCGFNRLTEKSYNGYKASIYSRSDIAIYFDDGILTWGLFLPLKIYYLHQLQNLYFALTGTELDVSKLFQPEVKTA